MPPWATVVITLGSASIAALAALGGVLLQMQHTTKEREASEKSRLRQDGAAAAGPVRALLIDGEPMRIVTNVGEHTSETLNELWERWHALRDALMIYAAGHPSIRVRELTNELVSAVPNSLTNTTWAVHTLDRAETGAVLEAARTSHKRAVDLTEEVLNEIRQSAGVSSGIGPGAETETSERRT